MSDEFQKLGSVLAGGDTNLSATASRDEIGNAYCMGEGIEIGAGSRPTKVSSNAIVHYADKRTPEELKTYFATDDVVNVESLSSFDGRKFDFVIAHHVLEHSANVIQTLVDWMHLLQSGGVLYLSLPNRHITPDAARLLTPPTHFLLDYVYQTTEDDYESREHICSFLWSWIDTGGLQGKSKLESASLVAASLNSDENDLHWHTFNMDTFQFVVNMAADFAGFSADLQFSQDGFKHQSEHRLVCTLKKKGKGKLGKLNKIQRLKKELRHTIYEATVECMEGVATFALSKEHKGKISIIENGKINWVRSPLTLEEKGLSNIDYTYLEISEAESGMIGEDVVDHVLDRRYFITSRLKGLEKEQGIELSPGATPIVDKHTFKVLYVDKFDHSVNSGYDWGGAPVSIDTVLGDRLLDEVLKHDKYSYLISSHVIEHIPDFIQFFKSASAILRDGARLIMYVPDKRYTFDVLREPSSVGDIEQAHKLQLRHPSHFMVKDYYENLDTSADACAIWEGSHVAKPNYDSNESSQIISGLDLSTADVHCFTFTPESFLQLMNYVKEEHQLNFEVCEITETAYGGNEFIVDLLFRKS